MDNYEIIKSEYEESKISFVQLSSKYNIPHWKIQRTAKKDKWVKFISNFKEVKNNADSKPTERYLFFQEKYKEIPFRKTDELKEELGEHYSPVDEPLLVMYSNLYQKYLILAELIAEEGDLVVSSKGVPYTNPRFNNYLAIVERLGKIGDKIGLSISSRKKMGIVIGVRVEQKTIFDYFESIPRGPQ